VQKDRPDIRPKTELLFDVLPAALVDLLQRERHHAEQHTQQ
jgi:hypothetical protein